MIPHSRSYSAKAHETLNAHVNGLIGETHSAADVRRHFDESQETEGTALGVAPGSLDGAKNICKSVLRTRLRESATDAIYAGRNRDQHIGKFESSLSEAKASGWLDDEIRLDEFSHLLRNFQVRSQAGRTRDHSTAESLVNQLHAHIQPPAEGEAASALMLTDTTLVVILRSLLRMMLRSPEACNKLVDLGLVDVVSKLFSSEGLDYKVQGPNPDFPEIQMCLARVLAEVVFQSCLESTSSVMRPDSRTRMYSDELPAPPSPEPPPISGAAQLALSTLVGGLKQSLRRSEHAAVWAVIMSIQRLGQDPFACKQLLGAGLLPVLRNASTLYAEQESGGRLPLAMPRPKLRPPMTSQEIPGFIGAVTVPGAVTTQRTASSVKERWLVRAESMPELPPRRTSAQFLAGSPVARSKGKGKRRGQLTPLAKMGQTTFPVAKAVPGWPLQDDSLPSLLWLMGEDSVDKESFYRVCDRSFMLLQLRKLLRMLEEAHLRYKPTAPAATWLAGGIMANRPDSRAATAGSRTGTGSRRGKSSSMLSPPAKGSDMWDERFGTTR